MHRGPAVRIRSRQDESGSCQSGDLLDLYRSGSLTEAERESQRVFQVTFDSMNGGATLLRPSWVLQQIPHIFRYKFRCDVPTCRAHDMTCEDWELFEAYRKWPERYLTEEETWSKIRQRFFDYFKRRSPLLPWDTHHVSELDDNRDVLSSEERLDVREVTRWLCQEMSPHVKG